MDFGVTLIFVRRGEGEGGCVRVTTNTDRQAGRQAVM